MNSVVVYMFLFFGLFFFIYFNSFANRECFSNKLNLIFLGDSIFKNDTYVSENKSVGDLLKKYYGSDIVKIYAEDGATIYDMPEQISSIKSKKKYNNNNTHIFVSFGGNDIIENFIDFVTGVTLEELFKDYKKGLFKLKTRLPDAKIHLATIYYPKDTPYYNYYNIIEAWNNKIMHYAKKNKLSVIRLDKFFKTQADFTHSIEPSFKGGNIILDRVKKLT